MAVEREQHSAWSIFVGSFDDLVSSHSYLNRVVVVLAMVSQVYAPPECEFSVSPLIDFLPFSFL